MEPGVTAAERIRVYAALRADANRLRAYGGFLPPRVEALETPLGWVALRCLGCSLVEAALRWLRLSKPG